MPRIKRILEVSKEYVYWKYKLSTKYKSKDRAALASFPRSGNTWTRVLIEEATGQEAGSIYNDKVFKRGSEGIVIKTHGRDSFKYNKAIIVVRNPYDAISSYYHWKRDVGGNQTLEWDAHVDECIERWKLFHQHWMNATYDKKIIHFERLLESPQSNLKDICTFLVCDVSDDQIKRAVEEPTLSKMRKNKESGDIGTKFFRQGKKNAGKVSFTTAQKEKISSVLGPMAKELGYNL